MISIGRDGRSYKFTDLTGRVFGELIVKMIGQRRDNRGRQRYWLCVCSCGATKECRGTHLTAGKIRSCGNKSLHYSTPAEERFWKYVNKTDFCWEWTGAIDSGWYGAFNTGADIEHTHRFSWILHNGPIPAGLSVLHRCDNPRCVCPDHLFLGTQLDNMNDARSKGRMRGRVTERNAA